MPEFADFLAREERIRGIAERLGLVSTRLYATDASPDDPWFRVAVVEVRGLAQELNALLADDIAHSFHGST